MNTCDKVEYIEFESEIRKGQDDEKHHLPDQMLIFTLVDKVTKCQTLCE